MRRPRLRASERGRYGADEALGQWHQLVVDRYGGARGLMNTLADYQKAQVYSVRQTLWPGARYKNRKGWRVGTWLAMRYVTGEINAPELRSYWSYIDPGVDALCDRWELGSGMTLREHAEALWRPPWAKMEALPVAL